MPLVRRGAALCLALVASVTVAVPAGADAAHHRLHQAKVKAARLDAQARAQAVQVKAARARLARLAAQSNAALSALQAAAQFSAKMAAADQAAQQVVEAATQQTNAARDTVNRMAANAYRSQASGGAFAATLQLVQSGDPASLLNGMNLLDQVGKTEGEAVDEFRLAQQRQQRAEHGAAQAASAAAAAEVGARTAKQHADALVAEQKTAVTALDALLAATRQAARKAHRHATALERAIAAAEARAAAIRRAQAAAAAQMPVPGCDGGSLAGDGNGQLPASALCGLWGAPGEMLRADASAAFNAMSQAYADVFGTPLCVNASYRTYQRQVELYATMPAGYAAVPGTSNHGWALAVDLCGGIQVDGSPQHEWLLDHAAEFNWFHPAWAMPGGPGPHEPWHWEYAG